MTSAHALSNMHTVSCFNCVEKTYVFMCTFCLHKHLDWDIIGRVDDLLM